MIDTFLKMKSRKQDDQVKFPTITIQSDDDHHYQENEIVIL